MPSAPSSSSASSPRPDLGYAAMDAEREVPIPEVPTIVDAEILQHPGSGSDSLLVTTESGDRVAFGFEVESGSPGLVFVEPSLWLQPADSAEQSDVAFQAEHGVADEWLQAV